MPAVPPHPIRAVLFDLDDTLFDHRGSARVALLKLRQGIPCFGARPFEALERDYHELLEEYHLKVLDGSLGLEDARRERFRQLLRRSGVEASAAEATDVSRTYHATYLAAYQPVAGAEALLRALAGRVKIGIVTNNLVAEQKRKLRVCGLAELIDALVVSEEVGAVKPDPAIFQIALARMDCPATAAVMIGDAWAVDVLGARAAGIRPIWFNRLGRPHPDPAVADELRSLEPTEAVLGLIFGEAQGKRP